MTRRTSISWGTSRIRSTSDREQGGVLVEFAISITVLWLLVAATLDLGRAFVASQLLQTAARTSARAVALDDRTAWDAPFEAGLAAVFDPADAAAQDLELGPLEDRRVTPPARPPPPGAASPPRSAPCPHTTLLRPQSRLPLLLSLFMQLPLMPLRLHLRLLLRPLLRLLLRLPLQLLFFRPPTSRMSPATGATAIKWQT